MNMSSGCVLVATADEFRAGTGVEISIEWPFRLDGRIPLQLVASGKVVRSETTSFALLLTRHQFRFTKKRMRHSIHLTTTLRIKPQECRQLLSATA